MKQITLTGLLVLLLSATQAQEYKVERGTLSFGLHMLAHKTTLEIPNTMMVGGLTGVTSVEGIPINHH
jgi:hypothetical protein